MHINKDFTSNQIINHKKIKNNKKKHNKKNLVCKTRCFDLPHCSFFIYKIKTYKLILQKDIIFSHLRFLLIQLYASVRGILSCTFDNLIPDIIHIKGYETLNP